MVPCKATSALAGIALAPPTWDNGSWSTPDDAVLVYHVPYELRVRGKYLRHVFVGQHPSESIAWGQMLEDGGCYPVRLKYSGEVRLQH